MPCISNTVICFDLDDTLYKEIDFLKSGYQKVAEMVNKRFHINAQDIYCSLLSWYKRGENPFVCLNEFYGIDIPLRDYLDIYRNHHPSISLSNDTKEALTLLKNSCAMLCIITDGREITQKQKVDALGLTKWINIENILINEDVRLFKPNNWSFERTMINCFKQCKNTNLSFCYIGDNPSKDFFAPNKLGWKTICLIDDGRNVHKQDFGLPKEFLPQCKVTDISEVFNLFLE